MLWDMHLCVFDVRLSFENRVSYMIVDWFCYTIELWMGTTCSMLKFANVEDH